MKKRQDREIANIDRDVYMELKYWCYQYDTWKREIKDLNASLAPSGLKCDGMPHSRDVSSSVEKKAIRIKMLQSKIDMLEKAAQMTSEEFMSYIILYCTKKDISFETLQGYYNIPCSKRTFFRLRTQFFRNLCKLKENM